MAAKRARSAFEEFETESKGRGLRSLQSFAPGDRVFSEPPAVFVLSNKVRGQRCDACFAAKDDLRRCTRCKVARYCGVNCQRAAWKYHKKECKRLEHVSPRVPTDLVQLMYRVLQERSSKAGANLTWYDTLVSNVDAIEEERRSEFGPVMAVLNEYAGQELIEQFIPTEVFELFGKISCNSFSICNGEMQAVGVGIYPISSRLNHSCSPNCVAIFNGTEVIINAVHKIGPEDEITISYTEHLRPSGERRKDLWSQYCFDCCCPRCMDSVEEDNLLLSLKCDHLGCNGLIIQEKCNQCGKISEPVVASEMHNKLQETLQEIKTMEKYGDFQDILDLCEKTLSSLPGLSPYNYLGIQLLDKAFDACIELEKWEQALEYGLKNKEPYVKLYPKYHPCTGILLFKIGKLEVLIRSLESGVQALQKAQVILETTHGKSHPLVQELREYLGQASEELRVESKNRAS